MQNTLSFVLAPSALVLNTPKIGLKRRKTQNLTFFPVGARKIDYFFILYVLNVLNLVLKMQKIAVFKLFVQKARKFFA